MEAFVDAHAIRVGPYFGAAFQRTLRIPDDGRTYPLPPGLGQFPIFDATPFPDAFPVAGDPSSPRAFFIPMYQREALWIGFRGAVWHPNAVLISMGGVNVVTGAVDGPAGRILKGSPQNYLVTPLQPWLDGFKTGNGAVRQFVAMPLGLGYSIEAAVTGEDRQGGIRITVFEPRPGRFPDVPPPEALTEKRPMAAMGGGGSFRMGLGAGGIMRQRIYPDPHGLETWDPGNFGEVAIHILNSARFREITGQAPPPTPVDAAAYTRHGFPWFDLYDEAKGDLPGSAILASARTVRERDAERGIDETPESIEISPEQRKRLGRSGRTVPKKN